MDRLIQILGVVLVAALLITGNITSGELATGLSNVEVYAQDALGNVGVSETDSFTIEAPVLITWFIAAIVLSIAGGVLLAVYWFTKRRRMKGRSRQKT